MRLAKDQTVGRNVIYESACTTCNPHVNSNCQIQYSTRLEEMETLSSQTQPVTEKIRTGIYIGERSRSVHERSCKHLRYIKSHMQNLEYLSSHNIGMHSPDKLEKPSPSYSRYVLLNSKSEYMNKCLTRVTVDKRDWDRTERERLDELNENIENKN